MIDDLLNQYGNIIKIQNIDKHQFVIDMFNILKTYIKPNDIHYNKYHIEKLHNSQYPIIYDAYKYVAHREITYEGFVEIYRKNGNDTISAIKKYPSIPLLINNKHRKHLNKLLYSSGYVALLIQQEAETNNLVCRKYASNDLTVRIYTHLHDKLNIDIILKIIYFMKKLTKKKEKIHVTIFGSNIKKIKPVEESMLGSDHINSGMSDGNNVFIWRKEEYEKVLIHELIHYLNVDECGKDRCFFNVPKEINDLIGKTTRSFEGYVESLAIILYSIFVSYNSNLNISKVMNIQKLFNLYQVKKIWKMFNYDNVITSTATIEYFFIKSIIIFDLIKFLDILNKSIWLSETKHDVENLVNNNYKQFLISVKEMTDIDDNINDVSMRMSILI